jgi:hypothetical protein
MFSVTYSLVLDTVDGGVQLRTLSGEVVLDVINLEDTSLLESPAGQLLSELTVHSGGLLSVGGLDRGREPLVLKRFDGAENSETGRVASLHGGDNVQLRASSQDILRSGHLFLGVVAVSSSGGLQNGSNKGAFTSQSLRGNPREGENTFAVKECLHIRTEGSRALEHKNVMLLGGREGVVVEVVDNNRRAIVCEVNVELEEERADGAGGGGLAGKGEEDVAILVHEVEDVLGGQRGAEACIIESIDKNPSQRN